MFEDATLLPDSPEENELVTAESVRIKKVLDLVKEGKSLSAAGKEVGGDQTLFRRPEVKAAINEFLEAGAFTDEVVRATLRGARLQAYTMLMKEGIYERDLGKLKIALGFDEAIASDPKIGLKAPPKVEVNLEFGSLKDLLGTVNKEEVIIDVEDLSELKTD